jgi:hypothetical protein
MTILVKIKTLYFTHLTHEEWYRFITILNTMLFDDQPHEDRVGKGYSALTLGVVELYNVLLGWAEKAKIALELIRKSAVTGLLAEADRTRDTHLCSARTLRQACPRRLRHGNSLFLQPH